MDKVAKIAPVGEPPTIDADRVERCGVGVRILDTHPLVYASVVARDLAAGLRRVDLVERCRPVVRVLDNGTLSQRIRRLRDLAAHFRERQV